MDYFEIKTKYGVRFIEAEKEGGENNMYWLTGLAGAIMMVAPWMFSYADNQTAVWTSLIAGVVVLGASLWEGFETRKENWEYWTAGIVGVLAVLAPFVLGFSNHVAALWTTVIMGAVIALLGFGKLWTGGVSRS